jgi:orotidine 5'-phosphate decarboxylase subfamily 2
MDALRRVCDEVRATGALCLLDNKRGDISTTAEAYASASYTALGADAVTVNGYMGRDSVEPFSKDATKGVFVLCKTSNPTSNEVQTLGVVGGGRVFEAVALAATTTWNSNSNVGLVVGATDREALAAVRAVAPQAWILAPGVGFQGGDLGAALGAGLRGDGMGMLLPVSRGISRASAPGVAAEELRMAINASVKATAAAAAAAAGSAAPPPPITLAPHSHTFLTAAIAADVLRFGSFTLKSGRQSPYFFNAGNFNTGKAVGALGRCYASAIAGAGIPFDVLFGPAYKGIPLATVAGAALAEHHGLDVQLCYNRKEAKDHGEGGTMVGASVAGKRVLIVDDVISAGTAVAEAVDIIKAAGGIPVAVVIGLDRQEKGGDGATLSAVQQVKETFGIPVTAVATLSALIGFLETAVAGGKTVAGITSQDLPDFLLKVKEYRDQWGVMG